ncbi:flagellar hook-associated protein 2 [Metabacillus herbersteinensis]|uniref:Flagellar hook-associated protein 2 n=1 Tax=Metabacillus herbersteinensis TaxID=283816 RepID=A0ABV6GEV4_9BACI
MRIGGLASGMDIDSLVSEMMKAERIPMDKMTKKKQTLEWQRDDYRGMNKILQELDDLMFLDKNGISREASFLKKSVTSSNESAVSAKAINAGSNITTNIEVDRLAKSASWKSAAVLPYTAGAAELSFTVKDPGATATRQVEISISATDTIDNVIAKLNTSSLGVTAMKEKIWDGAAYTDTIVFTSNATGTGGELTVNDSVTKSFLQEKLGFTDTNKWDGNKLLASTDGLDAVIKVNGFQMEKKSNIFTINGIEYTAKNVTTDPVTISSSTDVDGILDTIVKFVDKYNEVIGKINGEISETRYRDFQPLTDEEKEAMTEDQIEKWEEKAHSGLLKNDSVLSSGLNKMRSDFYSPVNGTDNLSGFTQLSAIGIKTSSNYLDKGKLILDEATLREKIQENPNALYELFNADGDNQETKGIARRIRGTIKGTIDSIEEKAGNTLTTNQSFTIGRNLDDVDNRIDAFQDRLLQLEDRYWRQFTEMEKAIQKANQQSAYITQQFSSGY